jgi:hypothetical protein
MTEYKNYDPQMEHIGSRNSIMFGSRSLYSEPVKVHRSHNLPILAQNSKGHCFEPIGRLVTVWHMSKQPEDGINLGFFEMNAAADSPVTTILEEIARATTALKDFKYRYGYGLEPVECKELWEKNFDRAYAFEEHFGRNEVGRAMRLSNIRHQTLDGLLFA